MSRRTAPSCDFPTAAAGSLENVEMIHVFLSTYQIKDKDLCECSVHI